MSKTESHARVMALPMCKLSVKSGSQKGVERTLHADVVRIGKAEGNDIVLPDETVSRQHCEIVREARGFLLRDLRSTNGTFLDGAEIREAYLRAGSVITVGDIEVRFQPIDEQLAIVPSPVEKLGELVGRSLKMRELFTILSRIAPTDATVLIEGEAGTGKDLVARTIHALSKRQKGPCIVVNCAAVSGKLVESELFGHDKGAFAGASTQRSGAFELAGGGTLYLDEVGALSYDLQSKLLRALESRGFRRVGGNRTLQTDVRVVASTRSDLSAAAKAGKFREDFLFRIAGVRVQLPPLRERKEDLPLLIAALGDRMAERGDRRPALDDAQLAQLTASDWPGNVTELRVLLERGQYISGTHEVQLPHGDTHAPVPEFDGTISYRANKERWELDFEKRYLAWLMARADGNVSRAARDADMDRKYLHKLLRKHELG